MGSLLRLLNDFVCVFSFQFAELYWTGLKLAYVCLCHCQKINEASYKERGSLRDNRTLVTIGEPYVLQELCHRVYCHLCPNTGSSE